MKQEDKELLLKDLCARLPYGVKYSLNGKTGTLDYNGSWVLLMNIKDSTSYIKPYLRPMSSITEEDIQNMFNSYYFKCNSQGIMLPCRGISELLIEYHKCYMPIDWLNSHHFDYRGLIEKGLALEAPKGMYNLKEK